MALDDSQSESEERVLFRTGLHPLAFSGAVTLALFVALVVVLLIRHNDLPASTDGQIALGGALIALLGTLPSALRWRNTMVAVTERRVLATSGGLRRRDLAVPLGPGVVDQDAGATGRLFDHGTLVIAGPDGSITSLRHVAHARELVEVARAQARRAGRRGGGPSAGRSGRLPAG